MLTGVMNRNEMNNYVDALCAGEKNIVRSVGVIFADINGLKVINDIEGHNAGDVSIKNAANTIREVVDEKNIYRAGGDEFTIILTGVTVEEIDAKIEEIRKASEQYDDVSLSLGGCVVDDSRNVREALRKADERMYEDKEKYYQEHPDKKYEAVMSRR